MNSHLILGILFFVAGLFQSISAILIFRGGKHYSQRYLGRKGSAILCLLAACCMYFLAWFHLVNR